jgi:hypothetical protein
LREVSALAPLLVFAFWIGLFPGVFLDRMGPTLDRLSRPAIERVENRNSESGTSAKPQAAFQFPNSAFILHHSSFIISPPTHAG